MVCTYMHMVGEERVNYKFQTLHASDIEAMGMSFSLLFFSFSMCAQARRGKQACEIGRETEGCVCVWLCLVEDVAREEGGLGLGFRV